MNKIYFKCGGGLGDCLNTFFVGPPLFAQSIKNADPDVVIYILCCSSNASILEAFENHPFFDKAILVKPFQEFIDVAEKELKEQGFVYWSTAYDQNQLTKQKQKIYLTPEEFNEVEAVKRMGPYIAVHPFNSAGTGITATHFEVNTDYRKIIEQILDCGYNLVQIGGNWRHNPSESIQTEEFVYEHPKFIDLVNKFNLRQIAHIVFGATKFIGTSSCWVVVATVNHVPSFMMLPHHMNDILLDEQKTGQGLRGTLIHTYGLKSGAAIPELYQLTEAFIQEI
jgi:ADP-heptose:LPS heptosyltransferase